MTDAKTAIWDALSKTDPAHTKGFSRAGGFKGTAIKPQWVVQRLTEYFGPCGDGWGINQPTFEVVPAGGDVLVYCAVSAWHGTRETVVWGVGGDKVLTQRQSGPFTDDEAFKKAFTDAIMNAFKFIGVAADVHMGRFDDSKYVDQMKEEFSPPVPAPAKPTLADRANKLEDALRNAPLADLDKAWAKGSALCAELDASLPERLAELEQLYEGLKDPIPF